MKVANAQQPSPYTEIPIAPQFDLAPHQAPESRAQLNQVKQNINQARAQIALIMRGEAQLNTSFTLGEGTPGAVQMTTQGLLKGWYENNIFAQFTHARSMGDLSAQRLTFVNELNTRCQNDAMYQHIANNVVLPQMQKFITGNFHPAVKYNAMLIVGQMNQQSNFNPAQTRRVPVPSTGALSFLVQNVQGGAANDAILLASWVGVLRHVSMNRLTNHIPGNNQVVIATQALSLLNQDAVAAGRTPSGQTWLQRRALEVLSAIGRDNGQILPAIVAIVKDDDAPISLRLSAAKALHYFYYDAQTKVAVEDTSNALGLLAIKICRNEFARVEAEKEAEAAQTAGGVADFGDGMGGMGGAIGGIDGGMGGMGGMMGGDVFGGGASVLSKEEKRRVDYSRRILAYQLYHVVLAIGKEGRQAGPNTIPSTGMVLAAAQDNAGKAALTKLQESMDELIATIRMPANNSTVSPDEPVEEPDRETMLADLEDEVRKFESFLLPAAVPVEAAAPAAKPEETTPVVPGS
ncbi:MAG: hypothetical protein MK324_07660 [Pirellulales bacterium]|nr:hypothetical protein [Pirellulales bacterium]